MGRSTAGRRTAAPDRDEVVAELLWVIEAAEEHLGSERASHYLRKFYPWYLARIGVAHGEAAQCQRLEDLDDARARVCELAGDRLAAA